MTPHAILAPACPVVLLSGKLPFPKSSSSAWSTYDLPRTDVSPESYIKLLVNTNVASVALAYITIFPQSPTCLISSKGPAWSWLKGLKWGPAEVHPCIKLPNWWIWSPWLPGVKS